MKTEIRREMDQLNRRIDQIDKQVSTILQLLTANNSLEAPSAPAAGQKSLRAVQSPSFMDTITEQEEETNSSVEAIDNVGNGGKQLKMSKTEQECEQQLNKNSGGHAAQSSPKDEHCVMQQDLEDVF